ncbi:MAG: aldose epimerase family protein [Alistipes sp.]
MTNAGGASVKLTNIGATVVSVEVPDRDGRLANVALGYDDFKVISATGRAWENGRPVRQPDPGSEIYVGRCGIPIVGELLEGRHHTHGGGINGFANKIWESRVETDRVVFSLFSPDGDQGYPGDLNAEVVYDWSDDCELEITYYAKTTAPTIINLTNHSYFNLKGEDRPGAMDQLLQINGSKYLRYDADCVCTGELVDVKGTPMDFSEPKALSAEIDADYEPLRFGSGYDQSWAIDGYEKGKLSEAGVLYDPQSGRRMRIRTTQPSIHIYAGNYLEGCPQSISGHPYGRRAGVAIECQAYPNSPNCPGFPSTVLRPGEIYNEKIVFRFETDAN